MLKIGGALLGGFGARKAGKAQAKAAKLNAQLIEERTGVESLLRERQGAAELGTIRANAGASGLAGGGSVSDVLAMSARNAAYDIASIRKQGDLERRATLLGGSAAKAAGNFGLLGGVLDAGTSAVALLRRRG